MANGNANVNDGRASLNPQRLGARQRLRAAMAGKTSASRICFRRTCAVSLAQGAKTDSVPVASRATQPPRAAGGGNKDGTAHH